MVTLSPQLMNAVNLRAGLLGTPLVNVARTWPVNFTSAEISTTASTTPSRKTAVMPTSTPASWPSPTAMTGLQWMRRSPAYWTPIVNMNAR